MTLSNSIDIVYERQWSSLGNLVHALTQAGRMGFLYGGFPKFRYTRAGIPTAKVRSFPVASLGNFLAAKLKLPANFFLEEPRWVGNWTARHSDLASTVIANGTAHRFLFPRIKCSPRTLILERGSMHPLDFFLKPQFARKEAGYPFSEQIPPAIVDEIEKTNLADYIIAGSMMVRDSYTSRDFPADRIFDGSYGINTEAYPFKERQPPQSRPIRIAIVGVIGFRKGLYRLLKMGDWAARKNIKIELHFAGPVQDPEAHEMFANSKATCIQHGTIKGPKLTELLTESDLYALPSYEEGLPFSVLEAMSSGLSAIVSNDTGAREPVEHGTSGLILHRFDDEEFDAELEPVLRNPARIVEMGRAARSSIERNYTLDHFCRRIFSNLEKIDAKS